jgi:hypothetical protein
MALSLSDQMSAPSIRMDPAVGRLSPPIIAINVDFPEPDRPITAA